MKTLKKVMEIVFLIGNDWLIHVMAGTYFALTLGWGGIFPSFISHFTIDMIPHGHFSLLAKPKLGHALEIAKGILAGITICLLVWIIFDFTKAIVVAVNIFSALAFDFIGFGAEILDEKEIWKRFSFSVGRIIIMVLGSIFILNNLVQWFENSKKFQNYWSEEKKYNCGLSSHHSLRPGIYNLVHLAVVAILSIATYHHLFL